MPLGGRPRASEVWSADTLHHDPHVGVAEEAPARHQTRNHQLSQTCNTRKAWADGDVSLCRLIDGRFSQTPHDLVPQRPCNDDDPASGRPCIVAPDCLTGVGHSQSRRIHPAG